MLSKMIRKAKKNKGFTLIELIVVIAIIAILALILIPRFGGFRDQAQNTANRATERTIHSAVAAALSARTIVQTPGSAATIPLKDGTVLDAADPCTGLVTGDAAVQTALQDLLGTTLDGDWDISITADGEITVTPG